MHHKPLFNKECGLTISRNMSVWKVFSFLRVLIWNENLECFCLPKTWSPKAELLTALRAEFTFGVTCTHSKDFCMSKRKKERNFPFYVRFKFNTTIPDLNRICWILTWPWSEIPIAILWTTISKLISLFLQLILLGYKTFHYEILSIFYVVLSLISQFLSLCTHFCC